MSDLREQLAQALAENAKLKAMAQGRLSLKVSDKGVIVLSGLRRFPLSLYADEWTRVFGFREQVESFIVDNQAEIQAKSDSWKALTPEQQAKHETDAKAKAQTSRSSLVDSLVAAKAV